MISDGYHQKMSEYELMRYLKQRIYLLYVTATGVSNQTQVRIETLEPMKQLAEIQKALELMDETRSFIVNRYHAYKGAGDDLEASSADLFKQLLEAEKVAEVNRKRIRLEKKRRKEEEQANLLRLKLQKRQERSAKEVKTDAPLRPMKSRSNKVAIKKKGEKSYLLMKPEEIDYLRYVEGDPEIIALTNAAMMNAPPSTQ